MIETEEICMPLNRQAIDVKILNSKYIQGVQMAENYSVENNSSIGILLGLDYYWNVVSGKIRRSKSLPIAVETLFGWMLVGKTQQISDGNITNMFISTEEEKTLTSQLKQFWELESMGIKQDEKVAWTTDETEAYKKFEESLSYEDRKYHVGLPWKHLYDIKDNKEIAIRRFRNLNDRFKKKPELEDKYRAAMEEYISLGYAEKVDENEHSVVGRIHYLAHQAVLKETRESTQVRIVFDTSEKSNTQGYLNQHLYPGPTLQPHLNSIIMRFRLYNIAVTADIKKMFLNINIKPEDRNVLRFFWQKKNQENYSIYRNTVLPFGLNCSSFIAIATVHKHVEKYEKEFPNVVKELKYSMYVDDLLSGADTEEEALKFYEESCNILKEAGMELRKWNTNNKVVRNTFISDHVASLGEEKTFNESKEVEESSKILGIRWSTNTDNFIFQTKDIRNIAEGMRPTKRNIVSLSSRIYDPMGWVSPYIIQVKILIQQMWERGVEWDETLPPDLQEKWLKWLQEIYLLDKITIPRKYVEDSTVIIKRQLHVFGDASEKAFAASAYLRSEDDKGNISVALLYAKTRVAPVKKITLPRLELLAAVLAARIAKFVKQSLSLPDLDVTLWTDSDIVLHWVTSTSRSWKSFVANRVQEIQSLHEPSVWRKCPGKDNPADVPSRGCNVEYLLDHQVWWYGPIWLSKPEQSWPQKMKPSNESTQSFIDEQRIQVYLIQVKEVLIEPTKYSSFNKLMRITSYVKRFIYNCLHKDNRRSKVLSTEEMQESEKYWFNQIQVETFQDEIVKLKSNKVVKLDSKLKELSPYYDKQDKLIKMYGRLQYAELEETEKHPIILPYENYIVKLLVEEIHQQQIHAGVNHTLATIRNKFWILKARSLVKNVVKSCLICRRFSPRNWKVPRAPLPKDRIVRSLPFQTTGIDFTGPLYISNAGKLEKIYICLFTCAVTRSIHLELVSKLSTDSFLRAFRRFVARRGMVSTIYTDNAPTFKNSDKEITRCINMITKKKVQEYLTMNRVNWKFIAERAPWWGGFYERLMKTIKIPLRKILGRSKLSIDELYTVITEVESMVNSRPLTYIGDDPTSLVYITPASFLIQRPVVNFPVKALNVNKISSKRHLNVQIKYQEKYLNNIWNIWKNEYIKQLNMNTNDCKVNTPFIGQVVMMLEPQMPRSKWKMGIISALHMGRDNIIRSVTVRTTKGMFRRTLNHLAPLEVNKHYGTDFHGGEL